MAPEPTMAEAFTMQAAACDALGSHQYARLLTGLRAEIDGGGMLADLLADRRERPRRDAVPLRLLGALHRIVLRGGAPELAARYQSAGGDGGPIPVAAVLRAIEAHHAEIVESLGMQVQTNEVGRSAVLVAGLAAIARHTRTPVAIHEIGASAGLNLNWPHYRFVCGDTAAGDPDSPLRFDDVWAEPADLSGLDASEIVEVSGCDMAPIDLTDELGRLRLLSFVWPDQPERFARLSLALDIARAHPPVVEKADAAEWVASRLAARPADACTVVCHSIVWQYLSAPTKDSLRETLAAHGAHASATAPLAWLRMEPAGPVAELRVTLWPGDSAHEPGAVGSREVVLGTAGYHGADVRITGSL